MNLLFDGKCRFWLDESRLFQGNRRDGRLSHTNGAWSCEQVGVVFEQVDLPRGGQRGTLFSRNIEDVDGVVFRLQDQLVVFYSEYVHVRL